MTSSNVQSSNSSRTSPPLSGESFSELSQSGPGTASNASLTMTESAIPGDGAERSSFAGGNSEDGDLRLSRAFARMPVALAVAVPVRDFRVRRLLAMMPGEVIETRWGHGEDLPLASNDVQLAWSEFEVVDSRLAVRITRLA